MLKAALENGRKAIGIEKMPKYVEIAHERLNGVTPMMELLA
jgi:DNA modification methylase